MSDLTSAIVETLGQPVLVLEEDLTVAMANNAFLDCFGVSDSDTSGQYLFDLGNGQWNIPELKRLLNELLAGKEHIENYRVEHGFESIGHRIMVLNARRLGQEGHNRVLIAIDDVTERDLRQKELDGRQEFADKLIDSVREGLMVMDPDLKVERVNQSFCEMFRIDPKDAEGRKIYDLGNGQWDIRELREALEEILPNRKAFNDYEVTHDFPEIGRRTMLLNGRQLDHMPRILLAVRDETERRRHAQDQKLMVGELQHRVKNILANVQSIAGATLRRSSSLDVFKDAFMHRIQAMARAQDLLMRETRGVVDLKELLRLELEAHGWEEDGRLAISGMPIKLSRAQTQILAMVIHELATNAVKYGAFSRPGGRLDVQWLVDERGWLRFDWRESGLQLAGPPRRKGFGTGMIENSIRHSLGGESTLDFSRDGLSSRIRLPLDPEIQEAC